MKKVKIIILFIYILFSLISLGNIYAEDDKQVNNTSSGVELSKMSAKELLEFYKKNKDYGKKRLSLDYKKYIEGDWVVFRGEYIDFTTKKGIPNEPIIFQVNGEEKIYTTTENGIFELEMKKSEIKDDTKYRIIMNIGHYRNSSELIGKQLKNDSIYHFTVHKIQKNDNEYELSIEPIHNIFYKEGRKGFIYKEKVILIPSLFGIQGKTLYLLVFMIIVLLISLYARFQFTEAEKNRMPLNKNKK